MGLLTLAATPVSPSLVTADMRPANLSWNVEFLRLGEGDSQYYVVSSTTMEVKCF